MMGPMKKVEEEIQGRVERHKREAGKGDRP